MPPLQLSGVKLAISADDLVFSASWLVLVHLVWILLITWRGLRTGAWRMGVWQELLRFDAWCFAVIILIDIMMCCVSARLPLMWRQEQDRRGARVVSSLIWARLLASVPVGVTGLLELLLLLRFVVGALGLLPPAAPGPGGGATTIPDLGGWGCGGRHEWLENGLCILLVLSRLREQILLVIAVASSYLPFASLAKHALALLIRIAKIFRTDTKLMANVAKALCAIKGTDLEDTATPSDLAFGLILVQIRQKQGMMGYHLEPMSSRRWMSYPEGESPEAPLLSNEDLESSDGPARRRWLCPATKRRDGVCSHVPLDRLDASRKEDKQAMEDILHFFPFACGVYGLWVNFLNTSVFPGTSIPTPWRILRATLDALPWRQRAPLGGGKFGCLGLSPPQGPTDGDFAFRLNEYGLRRTVARGFSTLHTSLDVAVADEPPELLHATWRNFGVGTSPPFAVLAEHKHRRIVIAVRGTLDLKDSLADIGALPRAFDPDHFDLDFDNTGDYGYDNASPAAKEKGMFVHGSVLKCTYDCRKRLEKSRVLEDTLEIGGKCNGYEIVCTGHSLGAGIACLLALQLRRTLRQYLTHVGQDVRYIGYEPPGGLLSVELAVYVQNLGWVSTVCSHDIVSHLSIRGMQALREDAMQALRETRDRSKLQIAMLLLSKLTLIGRPLFCCLAVPLSYAFEQLGGGHLDKSFRESSPPVAPKPESMTDRIDFGYFLPPGKIAYFRPLRTECLFWGMTERVLDWTVEWARAADLEEIVVSPRSFECHFPNILMDAFGIAARKLLDNRPATYTKAPDSWVPSCIYP